jgi:multidrug efflux system outer membrane protein
MMKYWKRIISPVEKHVAGLLIMFIFSGCATVGPDYVRPEVPVPTQWNGESGGNSPAGQLDPKRLAEWWATFNDPELTSFVQRAIQRNLDLRKAAARVREARARRGISKAELFPSVKASGSAQHSHNGAQGGSVIGSDLTSAQVGSVTGPDLYSAGFDASWELDLFGGKRRSVEASQEDLEASEEDLRDVLVSLISEVALNYVEIRSYQGRLSIAEANSAAQTETYDITRWRFEAGLTTALDVEQARYNLEQTRSQIPTLQTSLEQAKNRLAVLLGLNPGSLKEELSERRPIPTAPVDIAIGVPADVLRNRPDVRRAERQLAAQTARIGVATAELYPKFTLTGSIGFEALSLSNLLDAASKVYSYGASFTWSIFNAGSIRQNIEVQNALQEQALIQYEASILSALKDVNNGFVAYAQEQLRRQSLMEASQAAQRAVDLAQSQYSSGLIDFQVVLDSQRSLLSFEEQLAVSKSAVTSDLISLYKALGGGWEPLASNEK